jgi:hypothetical protein
MLTPFDPSTMFHEFRFHAFLKETFGIDLYTHLIQNGSDVYLIPPNTPAIGFQDHGHAFVLSQLDCNWQLTIKHQGQDFITNIVEVPAHTPPGDMVLTFHGLKAEMIIELDLYIKQTEGRSFEAELREQRNKDIDPVPQRTKLPNTSIDLAEWECQLILNFVASGCNPKDAIKNAKQLITLQLNAPGGNPGDLSCFDKCKPSVDQK